MDQGVAYSFLKKPGCLPTPILPARLRAQHRLETASGYKDGALVKARAYLSTCWALSISRPVETIKRLMLSPTGLP